ncbi:MAG: orotate phosphoribosyltransferase [Proteobacteria bacterium]|jgi:orotate phosphoribosyltransferase|nr:orotate phosphoribosyltransferase [Pseudomonadota bacterium]
MTETTAFIKFALEKKVLQFGEFKTKAGRLSPYFFNLGNFNDGDSLKKLGEFYAQTIINSQIRFDMIFGPAYKGIPLASSIAIALSQKNKNIPFSFNRKEKKNHGEGGEIIGSPIQGNVLIIDDVISAGTSINHSVALIKELGGVPCGVVVAIDRQEKGESTLSAIQEVEKNHGIPVISLMNLNEIKNFLMSHEILSENLSALEDYQKRYGVN